MSDAASTCVCSHPADWHSHDGAGDCEYNPECKCQRFVSRDVCTCGPSEYCAADDCQGATGEAPFAATTARRWHRMGGYYRDDDGNEIVASGDEWMLLAGESVCFPFPTLAAAKRYVEENDV